VQENDKKVAELAEMVRAIRERVAANYPTEGAGGLRLPDLMPAVHARDAAEGKVAAIGTVNPRPPGLVNDITQAAKRTIARGLDWHIREQVEFNRAVLASIDSLIETHNETNRALADLSARLAAMEEPAKTVREVTDRVREVTDQWSAWKDEWQGKLNLTEIKFLRSVAELHHGFQHRTSEMEAAMQRGATEAQNAFLQRASQTEEINSDRLRLLEDSLRQSLQLLEESLRQSQRAKEEAVDAALARASDEIQKRLWGDLDTVRREVQSSIHRELRVLRQRAVIAAPENGRPEEREWPAIDWTLFAEKFRGPEEAIRKNFERYVPIFTGRGNVLDLGCGRGEFLELMRREGVPAIGIDLNSANIVTCRAKGLDVAEADFFDYLHEQPDASFGGIFCAQVVEHLQPPDVPRLIELCARKLKRGAPIAFETPNPECLAIFATHFYIDPTHVRPLPPALLHFYLEEAGFVEVSVDRFAAAVESWPELSQLPEAIRERFFAFLDYAISARNAS
jgi:O-antigen chain-terminating methyltransferase